MASEVENERADGLTEQAAQRVAAKDPVEAAKLARKALAIIPSHQKARQILQTLQKGEAASPIPDLINQFLQQGSAQDGRDAINQFRHHRQLSDSDASHCAQILLEHEAATSETLDELTVLAISSNASARHVLATQFSAQATLIFDRLWTRGHRSHGALISTVIDSSSWARSMDQQQAVRDAFQLNLSKIIAVGQDKDHIEWAMSAIAKLLATQSATLTSLVDADTFEIVVPYLDIRLPSALRAQATLALVKLLEITKDNGGEQHLRQFVTYHVGRGHNEDLIVAFSAAAAVFPILPTAAAALFLSEGFLQSLLPKLKKNLDATAERKNQKLEHAALDLFSAACIDKTCREAIFKYVFEWLQDVARGTGSESSGLAALVLAKISQVETENAPKQDIAQLAGVLTNMTLESSTDEERQNSIEGLAYASLDPKVKESIVNNKGLLQRLIQILQDKDSSSAASYGALNIIANVSAYKPAETEEQKRMSQLKAYANAIKSENNSPLSNDAHVTARCRKLMDAGIVPAVLTRGKNPSTATLTLVIQIIYSLAKEQKHRGVLSQQGAVRFLLIALARLDESSKEASSPLSVISRTASHALARILISSNPNHVFSGGLSASSAIRPLVDLLTQDPNEEQRDLLPIFESLLALTNLASMEDESIKEHIIRTSWQQIEDLMLNSNKLVRRASAELVCNLMASPLGVAKFADGSKQASNRMHILLALADVEDTATRRAAGGALAMLTEWDAAVKAVLDKERGIKILLDMCEDDDDEMKHRGVVCLLNMVSAPGDAGKEGVQKVKAANGKQILGTALQKAKNPTVLQLGVEVLKKLT